MYHTSRSLTFSRQTLRILTFCLICSPLTALPILVGCTPFAAQTAATTGPLVGQAHCVGNIEAPYGLVEVSDLGLLSRAMGKPGNGGLCDGKVFQVMQPLTVYRVWDSSKSAGKHGRWWSFTPPAGPVDAYRAKYAICPSWSRLDRVAQCHLRTGAEIVIGPGQSAQCNADDNYKLYPQSSYEQVYIPSYPNDVSTPSVVDCIEDVKWP